MGSRVLIDAAISGRIELFSSAPLLAELHGVLLRAKFRKILFARGLAAEDLFIGYASLSSLVKPADIARTIHDDPADDLVLATALAAQVDIIVSGDAHLLRLGKFEGIKIVPAAIAVEQALRGV